MKRISIVLSALILVFLLLAIHACKREDGGSNNKPSAAHPLTNFRGTYHVSFHEHSTLAGAPPPTDVCDTTYGMTVSLDTIAGDTSRLKLTLEASKLYCQSQYLYEWCFAAARTSDSTATGDNFAAFCNGSSNAPVTSSSFSVTGAVHISCTVNYTDITGGGGPSVPTYFTLIGTKN